MRRRERERQRDFVHVCMYGGQRIIWGNHFSPSTMWNPEFSENTIFFPRKPPMVTLFIPNCLCFSVVSLPHAGSKRACELPLCGSHSDAACHTVPRRSCGFLTWPRYWWAGRIRSAQSLESLCPAVALSCWYSSSLEMLVTLREWWRLTGLLPFHCPPAVTGGQSFSVSFPSPTFLLSWSICFRDRVFN